MEKPVEMTTPGPDCSNTAKQAAFLCAVGLMLGFAAAPFTAPDTAWIAEPRTLEFAPVVADTVAATAPKRAVSARSTEPLAITLGQAWTYFYDKSALFLDARTTRDYVKGHIEGSKSLPYSEMELYLDLLDSVAKDSTIVTYCSGADCELSVHLADE
ncbi:MAG: rhodanese-like domain-containing protein, partial [Candidatus Latescibacteria bacterium]|nr:rhodanese-like domain-containing protein [Candidatus Latescibacterota bacterium]